MELVLQEEEFYKLLSKARERLLVGEILLRFLTTYAVLKSN